MIFCCAFHCIYAQQSSTKVIQKMESLVDQFDQTFDATKQSDQLLLVFVPGSNDPFAKVYDKHKEKAVLPGVQFIGGFKEMMIGMDEDKKRKHLQDAYLFRYGKTHFPILLDLNSEVAQLLSIDGYGIIQIDLKNKVITDIKSFDFDRVEFFKALQPYFKPS